MKTSSILKKILILQLKKKINQTIEKQQQELENKLEIKLLKYSILVEIRLKKNYLIVSIILI